MTRLKKIFAELVAMIGVQAKVATVLEPYAWYWKGSLSLMNNDEARAKEAFGKSMSVAVDRVGVNKHGALLSRVRTFRKLRSRFMCT